MWVNFLFPDEFDPDWPLEWEPPEFHIVWEEDDDEEWEDDEELE